MNTKTIIKLKNSLDSIGSSVANHFRETTKMVKIGSGADRSIEDVMLTRYACHLIAQNGDPRKEEIAIVEGTEK